MTYIFGNWKMYLNLKESTNLAMVLQQTNFSVCPYITLGIFPNPLAFTSSYDLLKDTVFSLGAQNVGWTPKGAYTGSISAELYKDAGALYALVGHSERRYIFHETNDAIRKKVEACLEVGLTPVLCIGETLQDKEANKKEYRIKKQLMKVFDGLDLYNQKIIIAYEPVWAIGSGNPCNPKEAGETHILIRHELKQYTDNTIPIIYGGSVNANNVCTYVSHEAIDGVLPGYASTKAETIIPLFEHVIEFFESSS